MFFLDMLEKRRGLIINLSSVSGRRPVPLLALYSGTKGFVDLFSRLVNLGKKKRLLKFVFNIDH
jgi:short-subunit dehydrogenase